MKLLGMSDETRKTVLFYGLNTPGHRNTLLAIADKLKEDHGYRTVFLTLGPCSDNSIIDHGHEHFAIEEKSFLEADDQDECPATPVEGDSGRRKIKLKGYLKYEYILRTKIGPLLSEDCLTKFTSVIGAFKEMTYAEMIENHDNMSCAVDEINPDLVIIDHLIIPPCMMRPDTPWVKVWSANPLGCTQPKQEAVKYPHLMGCQLFDKERRNKMRLEEPQKWRALLDSWNSTVAEIQKVVGRLDTSTLDKFYQDKGFEPIPKGTWGHDSPHINLYLYPKEIDYDQDDDLFQYRPRWFRLDSQIRKTISELQPEVSRIWTERLARGMEGKREMVYFSLGSLVSGNHELMKKYVDIFSRDQNRLYVISKGPKGDKYELDPRNMIGGNYIPQTWFLERANLAIVHGGNNGIFECLYYGVPMIVMPVFGDQTDNAQRIEDMGLGRRFPVHECSAINLLKAVDEMLLDTELLKKVREVGEKIRARDTASKMSQMLKKLIEEKRLDQSYIDQITR